MSHLDVELKTLKTDTIEYWKLVNSQLAKGFDSLVEMDKELALEIISFLPSYSKMMIDRIIN